MVKLRYICKIFISFRNENKNVNIIGVLKVKILVREELIDIRYIHIVSY